jgi:phosphate uptake regulator
LTVSLPSDWLKKHHVTKGDEVHVSVESDGIRITPAQRSSQMSAVIDISGLDRTMIMYVIRSLYRRGFDKIEVSFNQPRVVYTRKNKVVAVADIINTEVARLIGFEIVEKNETRIVISDFSKSPDSDFDPIVRRIFLLIKGSLEQLITLPKDKSDQLQLNIKQTHDEVTKFISFAMRSLNKNTPLSYDKSTYYYHMLGILDRFMDNIKYGSHSTDFSKNTQKNLDLIKEAFENYYLCFYTFDLKRFSSINDMRYQIEALVISSLDMRILTMIEMIIDLLESRSGLQL